MAGLASPVSHPVQRQQDSVVAHWLHGVAVAREDQFSGAGQRAQQIQDFNCLSGQRNDVRGTAKSVFGFGVQGEVATSTHAGLPWLLYLRKQCKRPVHFWPFDGWEIPEGKSVVAEVYPSLWTRRFDKEGRDGDEQAAYAVVAWLQRADQNGTLEGAFNPSLKAEERRVADAEGWILGVV